MQAGRWLFAAVFSVFFTHFTALAKEEILPATGDSAVPAIILKIEGDGIASVRKKSGILETAGARGKLFPGDKVITDGRTAVHLILNDGTVVKLGFNSEFKLDRQEQHEKFISWFFHLAKGTMRALVEKIPAKDVRFRVETPSGTAGVRGTEFVLIHDEAAAASTLFIVEGNVSYGRPGCEKDNSCVDVKSGESLSIAANQAKISAPKKYSMTELFAASDDPKKSSADARLSVFKDARKVAMKFTQNMDEASLKKLYEDSTAELAAAQDRAIGRTKAVRVAMQAAVAGGTFEDTLAAADAYAENRGVFKSNANNGAENMVAQVVASKFALGDSVKKADAAGVFFDKPKKDGEDSWSSRSFTLKKNVDFEQSAAAKENRENLKKAEDEYGNTLAFAEAIAGDQILDKKNTMNAGAAKDAMTMPGAPAAAPEAAQVGAAAACENKSCMQAAIAHEMDVAAEGVVAAYQEKTVLAATNGRTAKGLPSLITTKFFTRVTPGNGCFTTKKECKRKLCTLKVKGGECAPGTYTNVCSTVRVPARCTQKQVP